MPMKSFCTGCHKDTEGCQDVCAGSQTTALPSAPLNNLQVTKSSSTLGVELEKTIIKAIYLKKT